MAGAVIGALRVNLGLDSAQFSRGARRVRGPLGDMQRQFRKAASGASDFGKAMASAALRLGAFVAAYAGVKRIIGAADEWTVLQNKVGAAIGDMEKAPVALRRALDIARSSFSDLSQTVDVYARAVGTFRDMGRSAAEAADFTESLNLAMVRSYTAGQQAESVTRALGKAMAVGKLQADGLETVLANAPFVAEQLADELGVTVSQLRGLASQGKITGDVIANTFTKRLQENAEAAAEMPWSMRGAMQAMKTEFQAFSGEVNAAIGVTSGLAQGIKFLSQHLNELAGFIIAGVGALTAYYLPAISSAIGAGLLWIANITGMGAVITAARTATLSWAGALTVLKGALISTGIGALIVGAGVLISKFIDLVRETGGFRKALEVAAEVGISALKWLSAGADALGDVLGGVAYSVKAAFLDVWASIQQSFADLIEFIGKGFQKVAGWYNAIAPALHNVGDTGVLPDGKNLKITDQDFSGLGSGAQSSAAAARAAVRAAQQQADDLFARSGSHFEGLETPAAAFKRLKEEAIAAREATDELGGAIDRTLSGEGGGGKGGKTGNGSGGRKAKDEIEDLKEVIGETTSVMDDLRQSFQSAFTGFVTGANSAREAIAGLLKSLSDLLANKAFTLLWGNILGGDPLATALTGAGVRGVVPSFAGGGFTGYGYRSGGLDGLGGFPAILHPNETVVDHTRGGQGGGAQQVHVTVGIDPQSGDLRAFVDQRANGIAAMHVAQHGRALPTLVAGINHDRRAR